MDISDVTVLACHDVAFELVNLVGCEDFFAAAVVADQPLFGREARYLISFFGCLIS